MKVPTEGTVALSQRSWLCCRVSSAGLVSYLSVFTRLFAPAIVSKKANCPPPVFLAPPWGQRWREKVRRRASTRPRDTLPFACACQSEPWRNPRPPVRGCRRTEMDEARCSSQPLPVMSVSAERSPRSLSWIKRRAARRSKSAGARMLTHVCSGCRATNPAWARKVNTYTMQQTPACQRRTALMATLKHQTLKDHPEKKKKKCDNIK